MIQIVVMSIGKHTKNRGSFRFVVPVVTDIVSVVEDTIATASIVGFLLTTAQLGPACHRLLQETRNLIARESQSCNSKGGVITISGKRWNNSFGHLNHTILERRTSDKKIVARSLRVKRCLWVLYCNTMFTITL